MTTTQVIRTIGGPTRPAARTMAVVILLTSIVGALLGGLSGLSGPRHSAGAMVLFTGEGGPGRGSLYAVGQYVLDRGDTWADVAESEVVADTAAALLGEPDGALDDSVTASVTTATAYLQLRVEAPTEAQAVRWAGAVAEATASTVSAQETVRAGLPRVTAAVVSVDDSTRDERMLDVRLGAVLGGVLGLLAGWLYAAFRRPGPWQDQLATPLETADQDAETRRVDQQVQIEVLGALLLGQSGRGVLVALIGLAGIFGYGLTGQVLIPLAVVVLAGIAGRTDLRFAAGGIIFAGLSVLPARIDVIDLGLITPTVLEISIVIGVVLMLVQYRPGAPIGAFTGPVLAVLGAMAVGMLVGLAAGIELATVISPVRAMLVLIAFFVIRQAFRGEPYQLFAVLLVSAAASSIVSLVAVPLDLELLQSSARDYVVTGAETADVNRLSNPVLALWSPLLVILAAGVIRLRPRWLWALLLIPCLALQALSFNRSTWAALLVLAVIVAVLRGGSRGVLLRAVAAVVIGAIGLGALQAGVFGAEGQAVALRVSSVLTGEALGEDSLSDRLGENEAAWATLRESPVLGTGIAVPYGDTLSTYDDNLDVSVVEDRPWIHNQYLRIWLWMGVLGLVAYGWVAVRLTAYAGFDRARRGRASTISVAGAAGMLAVAAQAVFQTSLDEPSSVISIAVILALIELAGEPPQDHRRPPRDRPVTTRGSMAV